jgi:hypothetical protein
MTYDRSPCNLLPHFFPLLFSVMSFLSPAFHYLSFRHAFPFSACALLCFVSFSFCSMQAPYSCVHSRLGFVTCLPGRIQLCVFVLRSTPLLCEAEPGFDDGEDEEGNAPKAEKVAQQNARFTAWNKRNLGSKMSSWRTVKVFRASACKVLRSLDNQVGSPYNSSHPVARPHSSLVDSSISLEELLFITMHRLMASQLWSSSDDALEIVACIGWSCLSECTRVVVLERLLTSFQPQHAVVSR